MKILVTGATGFIGKNLVKKLVGDGHEVNCLVRKNSKKNDIDFLKRLKVKLFYGDITKKETLENSIKNVDIVYHLAGILGDFSIPLDYYYKIHVIGTRNLLNLCKKQKFIYCSSAGILGSITEGDETDRLSPTNIYEKTKADAERLVLDYQNYVILRPEFVYGPYDLHVLKLFRSIKNKKFFLIGNGRTMIHPTYIDDLTYCLIRCLDKEIKNEIFMIAGERQIAVKDITKLAASILGVKLNKLNIPLFLAKVYIALFEPVLKVFNADPILTKSRLDFFTKTRTFSTKKAEKILNYNPIKLEQGLKKTIKWYRENGYL